MARPISSKLYDKSKRVYTLMSQRDIDADKKSYWSELEIRGPIKNLSPDLWTFTHLTALFLNDNNLQVSLTVCECRRQRSLVESGLVIVCLCGETTSIDTSM